MVDLGDQSEMTHHRIVEDLTEVIDRPDRYVRLAQLAHHIRLRHPVHPCGDERNERVAVFDPARVVGESAVLEKILKLDRAAEPFEERVVRAADVHEAIRRAERLIGNDRGVHVAFRMGHGPVGEVTRGLPR